MSSLTWVQTVSIMVTLLYWYQQPGHVNVLSQWRGHITIMIPLAIALCWYQHVCQSYRYMPMISSAMHDCDRYATCNEAWRSDCSWVTSSSGSPCKLEGSYASSQQKGKKQPLWSYNLMLNVAILSTDWHSQKAQLSQRMRSTLAGGQQVHVILRRCLHSISQKNCFRGKLTHILTLKMVHICNKSLLRILNV